MLQFNSKYLPLALLLLLVEVLTGLYLLSGNSFLWMDMLMYTPSIVLIVFVKWLTGTSKRPLPVVL
jgi:hypothetical protein